MDTTVPVAALLCLLLLCELSVKRETCLLNFYCYPLAEKFETFNFCSLFLIVGIIFY